MATPGGLPLPTAVAAAASEDDERPPLPTDGGYLLHSAVLEFEHPGSRKRCFLQATTQVHLINTHARILGGVVVCCLFAILKG